MSAAIAMAPSPAPHDRPAFAAVAPKPADLAPGPSPTRPLAAASRPPPTSVAVRSPSAHRVAPAPSRAPTSASPPSASAPAAKRPGSRSPRGHQPAQQQPPQQAPKSSPVALSSTKKSGRTPKIVVKEEPTSPDMQQSSRPRPRRLDLSRGGSNVSPASSGARPLTSSRDGLGIHEVGIACLSPGFVTKDPVVQEQLQRSMSVRDQQRFIIESRLQQASARTDGPVETPRDAPFTAKTPGMSRRSRAQGLSIVTPSADQFANERVVQSAPLGHSFTGRSQANPFARPLANKPTHVTTTTTTTTHIHHVPATQTNNRLPPLSDVIGDAIPRPADGALYARPESARPPLPSPGLPPMSAHGPHPPPQQSQQMPTPGRRDFRTAEEVQAEMSGGRPELLPKLVHYHLPQPATTPSPVGAHPPSARLPSESQSVGKRRPRAEYEDGVSPPLGHGPTARRRAPFGEGRDSPESTRRKKDEFLILCSRAWDLFHS